MARGNEILQRLRKLPESQKKIIVWAVTILIGIAMLAWWMPRFGEKISKSIQGPSIQEQLSLPEIGLPSLDISEEQLKAFEGQLNPLQETGSSSEEHTDGEQ